MVVATYVSSGLCLLGLGAASEKGKLKVAHYLNHKDTEGAGAEIELLGVY